MATRGLDVLIQDFEGNICFLDGSTSTVQLRSGSDKHAKLMRHHTFRVPGGDPLADCLDFLDLGLERVNRRWLTIEHRNRVTTVLAVTIYVGHDRTEQTVRLAADLVGGAVIDPQGTRAPLDVYAELLPGKRLLKDPLSKVASKEEGVGPVIAQRGKKSKLGNTQILRFIHDCEVKKHLLISLKWRLLVGKTAWRM